MTDFQNRLRELKDQSGKTQARIANELGITQQNFSYYINGREPDYDILIKISNYFHVSTDYLLGKTDFKNDYAENMTAKQLGLSEKAINMLLATSECVNEKRYKETKLPEELNQLLEAKDFYTLLTYIHTLKNINTAKFREEWSMSEVLGGTDEAYEYVLQKVERFFVKLIQTIAPPPDTEKEYYKMTPGEMSKFYKK